MKKLNPRQLIQLLQPRNVRRIKWYQYNLFSFMLIVACFAAIFGIWRVSQLATLAAILYGLFSVALLSEQESAEQDTLHFMQTCVVWSLALLGSLLCLVVACWALLATWTG